MNNKGQIDILFLILMMFGLAMIVVVGLLMFRPIVDQLQEQNPGLLVANNTKEQLPLLFTNFNIMFVVIFIFGVLAAMIAAFFIPTHPVIFVVSLILLILFTLFAGMFSNVYEAFADDPAVASEIDNFGLHRIFFDRLPFFMFIAMLLVVIVSYAKTRDSTRGI